jgi:hypothetical protein
MKDRFVCPCLLAMKAVLRVFLSYICMMGRIFEEEAKKHGAASLGLHVFGKNVNAIELYKKSGYKQASVSMNKIL